MLTAKQGSRSGMRYQRAVTGHSAFMGLHSGAGQALQTYMSWVNSLSKGEKGVQQGGLSPFRSEESPE